MAKRGGRRRGRKHETVYTEFESHLPDNLNDPEWAKPTKDRICIWSVKERIENAIIESIDQRYTGKIPNIARIIGLLHGE